LSFETHQEYSGYISLQRFDKFHIQFGIQLNRNFNWKKSSDEFMDDLEKLIVRIGKFGYSVVRINWGGRIYPGMLSTDEYVTFSFQISHTDEKSDEILNPYILEFDKYLERDSNINKILNESFLPRKEHYLNLCWYNAEIGQVVNENDIYNYVEQLHRNEDDFTDGDIGERIGQFSRYKLMEISTDSINLDEYDLDIDYMKDYKKMFIETNKLSTNCFRW